MASALVRQSLRPLRFSLRPSPAPAPSPLPVRLNKFRAQLQLHFRRLQSTKPSAPGPGQGPAAAPKSSAAAPISAAAAKATASAAAAASTAGAAAAAASAAGSSSGIVRISFLERLGPLTEFVKAYGRQQRRRPWITQLWTAVVIYFCADISAQNISGQPYDAERTIRSLIIGLGIAIPGYEWLIFLGNHFNYRSRYLTLAVKVIVAQSFYTPLYNTYFFGMQALLAGDSWDEIVARVKATVPVSSINSCKLWPAVTAFSFAFLAPEYRNAFNGLVAIFWQTYLSYLNRNAEQAAEKAGHAHHGLHMGKAVKEVAAPVVAAAAAAPAVAPAMVPAPAPAPAAVKVEQPVAVAVAVTDEQVPTEA